VRTTYARTFPVQFNDHARMSYSRAQVEGRFPSIETASPAADKSIYFLFQTPPDSEQVATFAGRYESTPFQRLDSIAIGR